MKKLLYSAAALALVCAVMQGKSHTATNEKDFCRLVDMHIGTGGHGHVFMGANVPFGMVQVGPTSIPDTWDWCSGYHESDSTVIGFSHTHLSGTGIGDLFDVTVMPIIGDVTYSRGKDRAPGLWSMADRTQEVAEPGYYRVPLTRYGIDAEMTATDRVGIHRYTFPASEEAAIVFDLDNGGCWDHPTETFIQADSPTTVSGYRHSTGWAKDQKVYFAAELSKPMESFSLHGDTAVYGRIGFRTSEGEQVLMKVAISPVSVEGARQNLLAEASGWDFDGYRRQAYDRWNSELSKINIETTCQETEKTFYTALYHTMIAPYLFCDADGGYRGADGNVYPYAGFTPYTVFSLWDTYRAQMPLMSIIHGQRYTDAINTMIDIADKQGRLPVWHLWGNETDCMVGNPGIIAVADAVVKHTPGVDAEKAMEAMLKTSNDTARGGLWRQEYGFIPSDKMTESIAFDMEYAIADGALANAARALGRADIAAEYDRRSHSYRNYFDKSTDFIRGRLTDGNFREPFDPQASAHRADDYCEGTAWQYTWLAPHDVEGLQACFGSRETALAKLDSLFVTDSQITGDLTSPDISGMIGQYAHGNEPGHHIPYLYAMMGEPDKSADLVRRILKEMYFAAPDGLSGNEDAGQMSAWYVLSALGIYEAEPAGGRYWFGSPIIDKAEVKVPGGVFTIQVNNNSDSNHFIKSISLNGRPYDKLYLNHADIMAGGLLEIEMTDTPSCR